MRLLGTSPLLAWAAGAEPALAQVAGFVAVAQLNRFTAAGGGA